MQIIYTCPKCGHDLEEIILTSNPPQHEKRCSNCGWHHIIEEKQDFFIRIPYTEREKNIVDLDNGWSITTNDTNITNIPSGCRSCSNHPINGGSEICHCIIGLNTFY